jgi:hypothetical protein
LLEVGAQRDAEATQTPQLQTASTTAAATLSAKHVLRTGTAPGRPYEGGCMPCKGVAMSGHFMEETDKTDRNFE